MVYPSEYLNLSYFRFFTKSSQFLDLRKNSLILPFPIAGLSSHRSFHVLQYTNMFTTLQSNIGPSTDGPMFLSAIDYDMNPCATNQSNTSCVMRRQWFTVDPPDTCIPYATFDKYMGAPLSPAAVSIV